jgi:hypothetical protein
MERAERDLKELKELDGAIAQESESLTARGAKGWTKNEIKIMEDLVKKGLANEEIEKKRDEEFERQTAEETKKRIEAFRSPPSTTFGLRPTPGKPQP